MALVASRNLAGRRNLVRIRQWETGIGVVERRIRPRRRIVAGCTDRSRKARGDVVRHGPAKRRRAVPGCLVAAITIRVRGRERVVVAYVAIRAGYHFARRRQLVRTRQSPAGHGVIKHDVRPQCRVVAGAAIGRRKRCSRR